MNHSIRSIRCFVLCVILGASLGMWACGPPGGDAAVEIYHAPEKFSRRSGDLTANVCGSISPSARGATFRLNDGPWLDLPQQEPRIPPPMFTIEMAPEDLLPGKNRLAIRPSSSAPGDRWVEIEFEYDPLPIELPHVEDWASPDLDVQDGYWEALEDDGEWRVRPKPGFEDYDRVLVVAGTFPEGRRVETELVYRGNTGKGPYGFGVLPMWGGRPDDEGLSPRRGWVFSLVWFYSRYKAVGMEFSSRVSDVLPAWVAAYRDFELESDEPYRIIVESWPEQDENGNHRHYRQRMKWWAADEPEPEHWLYLTDTGGAPLPEREYGVALVAHRCEVEFGPVSVLPLTGENR